MALLDAAMEGILVTTADLDSPGPTIIYANPAFEQMTGWSKEEIIGQSPRVMQGPNTDMSIFHDLKERLRQGEAWESSTVNYRKDGQEFIMESSIAPIYDAGGAICQYIAVQRDVTARVRAERNLEEAREAVIESLRKREFMLETFGKFVPTALVDRIISDAGILEPELREATIFFSDIAGFTTLTESMDPRAIMQLLNEYFSLVTESIERRGGVIHQFQGDAILATYNLPVEDSSHATNAVEAALEIQDKLDNFQFSNGETLSTRIGINTGAVVGGTVGSAGRRGYTVHGDAVNLAARIEQENKRFGTQVLITEDTMREIGDRFECRALETILVSGRSKRVTVYAVKRK